MGNEPQKTYKEICFEYFRGEISATDATRLKDFLADRENVRQMRVWEKEWAESQSASCSQIVSFGNISRKIQNRTARRALACGLTLLLVAGLVTTFALTRQARSVNAEAKMHIIESGCKENTKVTLPDGTLVWLNSASRLVYSDSFTKKDREVELSGEAYFEVAKDQKHPFVVNLGPGSITVTGTRFDVSAYGRESQIHAALMEGSITFRTDRATIDIIPGEVLTYTKSDNSITKKHSDVDAWTAWMRGSMNLSSLTYSDLFSRLSTVYRADIVYNPRKYSGNTVNLVLNSSESLENVMDALCVLAPLSWTRNPDGSITVSEN